MLGGWRFLGMVQKRPFSGNTRDLSANPDRSHVRAGVREFLAALLELEFRESAALKQIMNSIVLIH